MSHPDRQELHREVAHWDRRKPGWTLEQDFYIDPKIFVDEMARVFGQSWLFAGHMCQIPIPGDFFTYDIGRDSLIILHGLDGR